MEKQSNQYFESISKRNEVKFSLNRIIHLYIIIIPKIFSIREKIEIDKIEEDFKLNFRRIRNF